MKSLFYTIIIGTTICAMEKKSTESDTRNVPFCRYILQNYQIPECIKTAYEHRRNRSDVRAIFLALYNANYRYNKDGKDYETKKFVFATRDEILYRAAAHHARCIGYNGYNYEELFGPDYNHYNVIRFHLGMIGQREDWMPTKTGSALFELWKLYNKLQLDRVRATPPATIRKSTSRSRRTFSKPPAPANSRINVRKLDLNEESKQQGKVSKEKKVINS